MPGETDFPAELDDFPDLVGSQTLKASQHARRHNNLQAAVEAMQLKIGRDDSTNETSLDFRVNQRLWLTALVVDSAAELASVDPVLNEGQLAYATDTQEVRVGDGTSSWTELPRRMPERPDPEYATSTLAQTGISAATDITGLSVSFEVVNRPWRVRLVGTFIFVSAAGVTASLIIADGANTTKVLSSETGRGTTDTVGIAAPEEIITAPGSYTRKGRLQTNAGTASINANLATIVSILIAEEL